MPKYEVLTPLSNGRGMPPHSPGSVVELEPDHATDLVAVGALRPVAGEERVGDQAAAGEGEADGLDLLASAQAMMVELAKSSHKKLDTIISDEKVGEVKAAGAKATVAEKAAAITVQRLATLVNDADREELEALVKGAGFEDFEALDLGEDASDDDIKVALLETYKAAVGLG